MNINNLWTKLVPIDGEMIPITYSLDEVIVEQDADENLQTDSNTPQTSVDKVQAISAQIPSPQPTQAATPDSSKDTTLKATQIPLPALIKLPEESKTKLDKTPQIHPDYFLLPTGKDLLQQFEKAEPLQTPVSFEVTLHETSSPQPVEVSSQNEAKEPPDSVSILIDVPYAQIMQNAPHAVNVPIHQTLNISSNVESNAFDHIQALTRDAAQQASEKNPSWMSNMPMPSNDPFDQISKFLKNNSDQLSNNILKDKNYIALSDLTKLHIEPPKFSPPRQLTSIY